MSETIDLTWIVWKRTIKKHLYQFCSSQIVTSLLLLIAIYDHSKLSAKVDKEIKGMLYWDFLLQIPFLLIYTFIIFFLAFNFPNRSFYKIYSIVLMCLAVLQLFSFILVDSSPKLLGKHFAKKAEWKKKYYKWGRIGQQATMIMYAVTLGVLGFILYKASSMVPVRAIPPPQNVRVVRRQSRSPKPPPPQPSTGDDEDTE